MEIFEPIRSWLRNRAPQFGRPANRPVRYVPKRESNDPEPWKRFGGTQSEYEFWIPHVCGICCLKMVGDTLGLTEDLSLYRLTMMCADRGGFVVRQDGGVDGVFHHPLARLFRDLGMNCSVVGRLTTDRIIGEVLNGGFVMLSIDLAKVSPGMSGGHLVLVYDYSVLKDSFVLHDGSSIMRNSGEGIVIGSGELEFLSNGKGLVVTGPAR